ncbi:MAG: type II secretory pathway predicted ATPase ExeA, partial [Candidatus Azotimanducaceae bacterium]
MSQTFLKLTHNPFTPPREGFYSGADRKTHLDHIGHLSQWSRRMLVVTGPFGIGKSTLYRELWTNLDSDTKAARLSGAVVTDEREVLLGLAQGFGVAVDAAGHIDDLTSVLAQHIDEEHERERVCAILVDDAQLLDFAAIGGLMRLAGQSEARLVLFAEATVISNVTKAAKKNELEWFEIRLTGFPAADVRGYLEWRFDQAQYRGRLPFTDEQLDRITQRSGGNPNVIDFIANELLADLESGQYKKSGGGFPRRHILLALVLVVLVGLLYQLYQQPDRPVLIAQETVEEAPQDLQGGVVENLQQNLPEIVEESASEEVLPVAPTALQTEVDVDTGEDVPTSAEIAVTTEGLVEEQVQATVESAVETAVEVIGVLPDSVSTPQAEEVASVLEAAGVNGMDWFLRQNGEHFTLQLMTLSRRQGGIDLI